MQGALTSIVDILSVFESCIGRWTISDYLVHTQSWHTNKFGDSTKFEE